MREVRGAESVRPGGQVAALPEWINAVVSVPWELPQRPERDPCENVVFLLSRRQRFRLLSLC